MPAALDSSQMLMGYAIGGLVVAGFYRFIVWIRESPVKPDPWDAEVELKLEDAQETCPQCSTPQPTNAWFCQHCGRAVGPYNNLMPYLQIFSEGEVLRNCASRQFRNRPWIMIGYFLLGLTFFPVFLLPVYWFSLLQKWLRADGPQDRPED